MAVAVLPLAVLAALLAAPDQPGAIRLAGVALGWWIAGVAWMAGLTALALRPRPRLFGRSRVLGHALRFAGVWLSPGALVGVAPLLLGDGSRGLWPPLLLATAACLTVILLAAPWAALPPAVRPTVVDLVRYRKPDAGAALLPLGIAAAGSALLFLWAQLAAVRELARIGDWPERMAVGAAVLGILVLGWRERLVRRLALLGGFAVLAGLLLPFGAVVAVTTPALPRVFEAVASRPRLTFDAPGPWTEEARPLRGGGPQVLLRVTEEQRLMVVGSGRVRVEPRDGEAWSREMRGATELAVRAGDRVLVPDGLAIRFQAGRAIPDAPASGPDWLDAGSGPGARRDLVGLAVTVLVGALGLTATHAALAPGGRRDGAAPLGATLAGAGLATGVLWALYAAWLTPDVYAGGVTGGEVYELPARVAALGSAGPALRDMALAGLAGGGLGAAFAALGGMPRNLGRTAGRAWGPWVAVAGLGGLLATLVPVGPWPILVAALGLAASACAPAVLVACWGERLDAPALAAGAACGLVLFGGLTAASLAGLGTTSGPWLDWLASWPALAGVPLNALVVWALTPGLRPSPWDPVPPSLAGLH